jgi:hypothetical protein
MRSNINQFLIFAILFFFFGAAYFFVASYILVGVFFLLLSLPFLFVLVGLNIPLAIKRIRGVHETIEDNIEEEETINWSRVGPDWIKHPKELSMGNSTETHSDDTNGQTERVTKTDWSQYTYTYNTDNSRESYSGNSATSQKTQQQSPIQTESSRKKSARQLLELDRTYTEDELESAYREKVKHSHPDTDTGSREQFKEVKEAYEILLKS